MTKTPKPWPEFTEPPIEQLAEWLRVCTAAERERFVAAARASATEAQECFYKHQMPSRRGRHER